MGLHLYKFWTASNYWYHTKIPNPEGKLPSTRNKKPSNEEGNIDSTCYKYDKIITNAEQVSAFPIIINYKEHSLRIKWYPWFIFYFITTSLTNIVHYR